MQNYSMLLPHYSIGAEIYNNIPKFCLRTVKKSLQSAVIKQ